MMNIISKMTGVPLQKMEQKETEKLLAMEGELKGKVIGQDEAGRGDLEGAPPLPRRSQGSTPADRLVHVPRPDRCR